MPKKQPSSNVNGQLPSHNSIKPPRPKSAIPNNERDYQSEAQERVAALTAELDRIRSLYGQQSNALSLSEERNRSRGIEIERYELELTPLMRNKCAELAYLYTTTLPFQEEENRRLSAQVNHWERTVHLMRADNTDPRRRITELEGQVEYAKSLRQKAEEDSNSMRKELQLLRIELARVKANPEDSGHRISTSSQAMFASQNANNSSSNPQKSALYMAFTRPGP